MTDERIKQRNSILHFILRKSGGTQNNDACSPIPLDGNICTISCLDTSHIQAAIFDATDKSNLFA
jgi:hypothetical protein